MPAYVPNATNTSQPTSSQKVESAALEFRTLKATIVANTAAITANAAAAIAALNAATAKTLRVPESNVALLPPVAVRAGKVQAYDAAGNPVVIAVAGTTDPSLRTDLAASTGAALVGYTGGFTGELPQSVRDVISRLELDVKSWGAAGNNVRDDSLEFVAADLAASAAGVALRLPAGVYRFASNTVLASTILFDVGAVIKPNAEIKVTLAKAPKAGLHQIFDRSAGGAVQFLGGGVPEVYAEWWGARGGSGGRTDNNIPIQHALDALQSIIYTDFTTPAPNADNNGGTVVLGYSTDYLMSGKIHLRNRVRIIGQGRYTELKINNATWAGTELVLSQNGTSSQFHCRLENLSHNANDNTVITRVIYAPAWQESCGLRDVLVEKYRTHGVYIDSGFGGSVGVELRDTQFFPSINTTSGKSAIYVAAPYVSSVFNLLLTGVSFAGPSVSVPPVKDMSGVFATGRVRIQCRGVHIEGFDYGITLDTDASLYGRIGATGNGSVNSVVACNSGWTGRIDCDRINKGGATNLIKSFAVGAGNVFLTTPPVFGRVVYPASPSEVIAFARNTAAGGALESALYGFSTITRTGVGQYTLTIAPGQFAPPGGSSYNVRVDCANFTGGAGRTYYLAGKTATTIDLVFKNTTTGANADCDFFDVFVYGKQGV